MKVQTATPRSTWLEKAIRSLPRWAVLGIGIFDLGRGAFHWLAPDSGAASIAGMNLGYANARDVIFLLATAGLSQLFFGIWYVYFALRKPSLVPLALATEAAKSALLLLTELTFKRPVAPVPGRFAHAATLILTLISLLANLVTTHREQAQ